MQLNKDQMIYFVFSHIKAGGGAEKQVLMQAQALIKEGFSVKFLCKSIDVNHFYKYCPDGSYSFDIFKSLNLAKKNLVFSFLVHDHKYCIFYAILRKIRWIPFERTHPEYYQKFSHPHSIYRNIKFLILKILYSLFSSCLIVQTKDAKKIWQSLLICTKKPIYVINNIIHAKNCNNKEKNINVLKIIMIGRLIKIKDYPIAIKSFSILKENNINFKVSIYGDGPEHLNLVKMVQSLNLQNNVFFKGFCENMDDEIVSHDIFLITSVVEGMPNALGEAMSCSLPCLSLNFHADPKEFLGDDENQIIMERDPLLLANKIIEMFNEEKIKKIGEKNLKRALQLFSEEEFIKNFLLVYKNIIKIGYN